MIPSVAKLGKLLYRRLQPVLSEANKKFGEFNSYDVRIYDGDLKAFTQLHTDTRTKVGKDGKPKPTYQAPGTDAVIFTIGDNMLLWRKEYPAPPGDRGYPWLDLTCKETPKKKNATMKTRHSWALAPPSAAASTRLRPHCCATHACTSVSTWPWTTPWIAGQYTEWAEC